MGTSHHWNWNGAQPLTVDVAQVDVATNRALRGKAGSIYLFYIATNGEVLNAQQRIAGDSITWEVQPALSTTPASQKHVAVNAKQVAFAEATAGAIDLLVVTSKNQVLRFRQSGLGSPWVKTDPQPFVGNKIQQLAAAVDSLGQLQLVGLTTSGKVIRQRPISPGNLNWNPLQPIKGLAAKQVAIAANHNNSGLLEVFFIDK